MTDQATTTAAALATKLIAAGFVDGGCTCGDTRVVQTEPVTCPVYVFYCACGVRVGVEFSWASLAIELVPAPPRPVPCGVCGKFACKCEGVQHG